MDASEAREHLDLVDRIIAVSSQRLQAGGEYFVVWGLIGAAIDALVTAVNTELIPVWVLWAYPVLLLGGIGFSVLRVRHYKQCGARMSFLQREYLNVLWLTISVATVANFTTFFIFSNFVQQASLWTLTEAIVLLYVGLHGNRRAQVGGVILIASLVSANFMMPHAGWILAAGVLLGYAGFGAAELLARD